MNNFVDNLLEALSYIMYLLRAIIVVAGFLAFFLVIFLVSWVGRTDGTHVGIVTAVETNELIWETRRTYFKTSAEATRSMRYCVRNLGVYQQLNEAARSGDRVIIHFTHPLIEWQWHCSNEPAIIVDIQKAVNDE